MPQQALIVDDSKSACRFLAKLLAEHGVESDSVHSAEDALEYLRDKKPDVIFLDHNMPGMDGLETVKIIKGNPATATIPVLMYTTQEGEVYLGQARALGAVDVLVKESVHERLEESLARLGMVRGAVARTTEPRAATTAPDWEALLKRMETELSRQMYLILAEEQIAQKGQMRWLAGSVKGLLEVNSEETVRRLDAKQELRWEEQGVRERARFRFLTGLLALLVAIAALAGWWQLQRLAAVDRQVAVGSDAVQRQLSELRGALAALPRASGASVPAVVPAPLPVAAPAAPREAGSVLRGEDGAPLGRLLGTSASGAAYQGLSDTGYLFSVNTRGEIGYALQQRYFAAANCVGDPLVEAQPGLVFRDDARQLWYTAYAEPVNDVQPLSQLDETGNCHPVEQNAGPLRPLLANDPAVTGVSIQNEPVVLARP